MKIQEVIDCVLTDSTGETRIAPTCCQRCELYHYARTHLVHRP